MAVFAAHYYERAPVHFSWTTAASGTAGEMNATLADGSRFSGSFLQVQSDRLVPPEQIWTGWKYGWRNAELGGVWHRAALRDASSRRGDSQSHGAS